MIQEMQTFEARLASFDYVLHPDKRRNSGAKQTKPISWPHTSPSPAELAHAGFYYNPYETNPDNTTCFLCQRALDGWEEDDNPIAEHLKHSSDCGWAKMMDIQQRTSNPAEIEDPTSEEIVQARRATFGDRWPHDGKRGWVCQSEKMVEGGWYFCPTEESEDLATCPYCKLSLDGWEPKDDPFDEHYRRSSDCSFFVFAQAPGKKSKTSRAKKSRSSKTARLSTQSVATTVSEVPTVDTDHDMDQSILSQATTKAKGIKRAKKAKTKTEKTKVGSDVQEYGGMDSDDKDQAPVEPPKAKKATRGKKRHSDELNEDTPEGADHKTSTSELREPPSKRRAMAARDSSVQPSNPQSVDETAPVAQTDDQVVSLERPKKGRKIAPKTSTSRSRKVSEAAVSHHELPHHAEIETALAAGLEADVDTPHESKLLDRGANNASKAKTTNRSKKSTKPQHEMADMNNLDPHSDSDQMAELVDPPAKKSKSTKTKRVTSTKKAKKQTGLDDQAPERSAVSGKRDARETSPAVHDSFVSVEIVSRTADHPPDPEPDVTLSLDKTTKKAAAPTSKKRNGKISRVSREPDGASASDQRHSSHDVEVIEVDEDITASNDAPIMAESPPPQQTPVRWSSKTPPKTAERYSDIPAEKQLATAIAKRVSDNTITQDRSGGSAGQQRRAISPPASPSGSLSAQSSDAENKPPSAKPSATRIPVLTPTRNQAVRVAMPASTPSPSKQIDKSRSLTSANPWVPIDIDDILVTAGSDKENVDLNSVLNSVKGELTGTEMKMTVEEWIFWNARNGEERLKRECERLVSHFEREGGRAMRVLEGIECID